MGFPELGYASLKELQELKTTARINVRGKVMKFALPIERDLYFKPIHSMKVYSMAARNRRAITESTEELEQAATALGAAI